MEKDSSPSRLHALDGLRGLAIIMVFLSHANASIIVRKGIFIRTIFDSGVIGVTFLFILSGFLMAYLYPKPQGLKFLQKRYTRIFPLFLTMSFSLTVLQFINSTKWYMSFVVIILIALLVHLLWINVIKKYFSEKQTKLIFLGFIAIQVLVGLFYLWVMNHPAVYYYDQISQTYRLVLNGAVNMTLTLPVGRYVNMLDPVYWSLTAEVLFYILYPIVFAPFVGFISAKRNTYKLLLCAVLLPFFAGLALLSDKILYLDLLRIYLFYYFVMGISVGFLYKAKSKYITKIGDIFAGKLGILTPFIFVATVALAGVEIVFFGLSNQIISYLILSIPFALLVVVSLDPRNLLSKIFSSKPLVFIGTISYSIYLSHMQVYGAMIKLFGEPRNGTYLTLYLILTFLLAAAFSSVLFYLLERPYFKKRIEPKTTTVSHDYLPVKHLGKLLFFISAGYIFIVFVVFQSDINFLSVQDVYPKSSVTYPALRNDSYSLRTYSHLDLTFTASNNNLGIIYLDLTHQSVKGQKFSPQVVSIKIKEKDSSSWYYIINYKILTQHDPLEKNYGMPVILDSKGKTYVVEISDLNKNSSEFGVLNTTDFGMKSDYVINKRELIKNPTEIFSIGESKIKTVLGNKDAVEILVLGIPFIVVCGLLSIL